MRNQMLNLNSLEICRTWTDGLDQAINDRGRESVVEDLDMIGDQMSIGV